jgi:peptide/nickel transport system permease protein
VGTRRYLLRKCVQAFFTLVFVLCFNFFLFRVLPGDPARILARNKLMPADAVAELEADFGLDQPLFPQQFVNYVGDTVRGNLGISYTYRIPVTEVIADRFWRTVLLLGVSTTIFTVLGIYIGIWGGWRRGSSFDIGSLGFSLVGYSMPDFWLGLLLLLLFGVIIPLFPVGGITTAPVGTYTGLRAVYDVAGHMVLPTLTLVLAYIGEYTLVMRSSLLDVAGEEYIQTAHAKGLRDVMVRRRHAVPNALLPTVTLIALNLGFVVGGAITVETVFSWQGLGLLEYQALRAPDYPLLQGLFLLFSVAVIVANLVADIIYGYLDPRVKAA